MPETPVGARQLVRLGLPEVLPNFSGRKMGRIEGLQQLAQKLVFQVFHRIAVNIGQQLR